MFKFKVLAADKKARVGRLTTPHGEIDTPAFLPVGTQASVKALSSEDLKDIGCQIILANTYHLYLRPGADTIQRLGGLHQFMNWPGPIFTDSGGFQVFSLGFGIEHEVGKMVPLFGGGFSGGSDPVRQGPTLSGLSGRKLCKMTEEGPTFQSHLDGSVHFFPPEESVATQMKLGADFVVALDECTSPLHDYEYTKTAMERSHRWELRSLTEYKRLKSLKQKMFGVIQGGPFKGLRIQSAKFVSKNDFFGICLGGALVSPEKMQAILRWIHPHLDPQKPRHLFGIGTVPEIFLGVEQGMDMFDAVVPTRLARAGQLLQKSGPPLDLTKTIFKEDATPVFQNYSRAYLHHLFRSRELLAYRLATIHNVRFMMTLMSQIREAIESHKFAKLKADWLKYPEEVERQ